MTIEPRDPVLGVGHKSIPPGMWGRRASDVAAERHPASAFATPLLVLDRDVAATNVARLVAWAGERGFVLAPHGKTTMAPELWRRLLDAGCVGITVATPWQAQVARAAGVQRILLANQLVDPVAAQWVADELDAHPALSFACWVDSPPAIEVLAATAGERPIDVLVELGEAGGRTGARGVEAALAVADAVAREPRLRLRGVAGYEGSYGSDRAPETVARVRGYLARLAAFAERLLTDHDIREPVVTAGGSTWFDVVAEELAGLVGRAELVLRSGAFQAHDDAFYAGNAAGFGGSEQLEPALTVFARVLSRPEPGLVLLDAGKRDVPSDLGLPLVLQAADGRALPGARVVALNDQHAHVAVPPEPPLAVGEVVLLGIAHPCTAFDRWRLVPEVEGARGADPRVVGFVSTFF